MLDGELEFQRDEMGCSAFARRVCLKSSSSNKRAYAVLTPGQGSKPKSVDINDFHVCFGHAHANALRATARRLGIKLTGEMKPCKGCLMAKGRRRPIARQTLTRAKRKLERVYVDLAGPMPV